ncbi:MAG: hypothetical protein ACK5IN_07640 [Microbacterium sp.]|uniref:hypothetical protein n=1 Tax=Microbacterium sp. TaxID=51671 RepID=UPI003A83FB65
MRPNRARGALAVVASIGLSLGILMPVGAAVAAPVDAVDAAVRPATLVGFDPGNIMSDAVFYDAHAMTSAQIQSFLDSKVGACNSNDCINILRANVSSRAKRVSETTGNVVCEAFTGGNNLRVSEIIYRAQVACGISAKVILATLQKEQGLVTSKNPSDWNLSYAMGQACPDTAPCDPAYKGIGVQILAGATQLKTYKAANFARQPGVHNIQYSPNASCGTMRVNIVNYATAALYNYTPYTPNAAALSAGYGLGDACSSYGNRNFYNYYTDWFGSTQASAPSAPTNVTAIGGNGKAVVSWAAPTNTGGSPITKYTVAAQPGGKTATSPTTTRTGSGRRRCLLDIRRSATSMTS